MAFAAMGELRAACECKAIAWSYRCMCSGYWTSCCLTCCCFAAQLLIICPVSNLSCFLALVSSGMTQSTRKLAVYLFRTHSSCQKSDTFLNTQRTFARVPFTLAMVEGSESLCFCQIRGAIRHKYDIPGNLLGDCCCTCWYCPSSCQHF
jgi:hypothetical protein